MSSIDLDEIRIRNRLEDVVSEVFPLKKQSARTLRAEQHDSLVVFTNTQTYYWYSRDEGGDIFDWVGREVLGYGQGWSSRNTDQFMEVVRWLAHRANITLPERGSGDFKKSPAYAECQLVQRLHEALLNHPPALAYATQKRGWSLATVKAAKLGYMPQDKKALLSDLTLTETWRSILAKFPVGMLVYSHREQGKLTYLSGRSIEGKQHYNPPRELMGERQLYFNHLYSRDAEQVVIVEGQADAVTFAEWGIPAVALAGLSSPETLKTQLQDHRRIFVALDSDSAGSRQTLDIAQLIGGSTRLVQFPDGCKDANELLQQGAVTDLAQRLLHRARHWLMVAVEQAAQLEGWAQHDALRDLLPYATDLDEFTQIEFKQQMAKLGLKGRALSDLMKPKAANGSATNTGSPQILGNDIPMLSPAPGLPS